MILHLLFSIFILSFAEKPPLTEISFSNGAKMKVEIAKNFSDRQKGLMHRTSLPENNGMLFIFNRPQKLSFWTKNTYIPLSIAYIGKDKKIKEIYEMNSQNLMERAQDIKTYPSECDCQFALEANQGWFKKNKVKIGDKVSFPFTVQK